IVSMACALRAIRGTHPGQRRTHLAQRAGPSPPPVRATSKNRDERLPHGRPIRICCSSLTHSARDRWFARERPFPFFYRSCKQKISEQESRLARARRVPLTQPPLSQRPAATRVG